MIIGENDYKTDLVKINNVRYLLFNTLYSKLECIENLSDIISRHIDCLSIDYSPTQYTYIIKIKKTSMRRQEGFDHNPNFYYNKMREVFTEFIKANEPYMTECLRTKYEDPRLSLEYMYSNTYIMANLCHVSCIADNILIIKL